MTNIQFLRVQALREADECGSIPEVWAEASADTVGEPNRATARYKKFREPTIGGRSSSEKQLASAPVHDGNPLPLAMSGDDFYRAACVEAHARLSNLR